MSGKSSKRKSSEKTVDDDEHKHSRTSTLMELSYPASTTSHPYSSEATAEQADDHVQVTTAALAEDCSETTFSRKKLDLATKHLTRNQLWNLLRQEKKPKDTVDMMFFRAKLPAILEALGSTVKQHLSVEEKEDFCKNVQSFYLKYEERWNEGSRRIRQKDKEWADSTFFIPAKFKPEDNSEQNEDISNELLPFPSSFVDLPPRTQYRHIQKTKKKISGEDIGKIIRAVASEVKDQSGANIQPDTAKATAYVLKMIAKSPSKPKKIAELVRKAEKEKTPIPYTPQEALAVLIDHGFTKETYTWLQRDITRRNFRALPSYSQLQQEKKLCYPETGVQVNERCASVLLQPLLDHTVKRIIEVQETDDDQKVISNFMLLNGLDEITCTLHASWGFDGSSCQSRYKQKFKQGEINDGDDQNMLATTLIPLRLMCDLCPATPFWENSTPQSVRYCRPLRLQFVKETKVVILNEFQCVEDEIEELQPYTITLNNCLKVNVNFLLHLTLIDGKVLSNITNTSAYSVCPICKATPKDMNDLPKMRAKKIFQENLRFGLSPLHAWIRVLEFLLHLGYKNQTGLRKAVLRKTTIVKKKLTARKKRIQNEIQKETGLLVDQPKSGGCGSTNDGNTARKALSSKFREKIAQILGLESWLLEDFHTILSVISSGLEIDPVKFGEFCDQLADKFVAKYSWYRMPATVHKILVHGKLVIESMSLPIGMLSEQAAESRHKLFRLFREKHTFKGDRETALRQIFQRSLESSDPVISEFRLYERQKKLQHRPLSLDAVNLLRPVVIPDLNDEDEETVADLDDHMDFGVELQEDMAIELSDEDVSDADEEAPDEDEEALDDDENASDEDEDISGEH